MKYSIVIPLKDEEGNIVDLVNEIEPVMHSLKEPWELILVDDGSKDQTVPLLRSLAKNKSYIKVIIFDKNYGQSSAFEAGFKEACGEWIVTLDGDRQNDPTDIPALLEAAKGKDLVVGIRQKRKDTSIKRLISKLANSVRSRALNDGIQDTGCSLKVYRKECLQSIKIFHGMHRFLPALFQIEGFSVGQIPVKHRERIQGQTKYNFLNRSFNTLSDLLAVRWMQKRRKLWQIKERIP